MDRFIRRYQETDLAAVMASWESGSKIAHPFLKPEFMDQERYNIPNVYLPNTETWVIEQGEEVIGFIALMGNEVGAIFVKSEFHGTGAGRALMDKAQELRGELEVEVFKENAIGRAFYSKYGFEQVEKKIFERTGDAILRLRFTTSGKSEPR